MKIGNNRVVNIIQHMVSATPPLIISIHTKRYVHLKGKGYFECKVSTNLIGSEIRQLCFYDEVAL